MGDKILQKSEGTGESSEAGQSTESNNTKLPEASSPLPGTETAQQSLEELAKKHSTGSRQGNSSIPSNNDETVGIP